MHIFCIKYGTVLSNTAVLCICVRTICLWVCGALVSVITTLYYLATIFHHRVWYRALYVCYACNRSLGIILIPQATFVPNFVSYAASTAELTHGEKSRTQSSTQWLTHPAYFMPQDPNVVIRNIVHRNILQWLRHWKTSETEPRDDRNYWPSGNINIGNLLVSSMCSRNLYTCNDNLHSAPRQNHRQHISVVSCKALPKITGKVKNLTPVKS